LFGASISSRAINGAEAAAGDIDVPIEISGAPFSASEIDPSKLKSFSRAK
jgi:hypothetical protein